MMGWQEEIMNSVEELSTWFHGDGLEFHDELYEKYSISVRFDGYVACIYFCGNILWDSDNEERDWDNAEDTYAVSLTEHLKGMVRAELTMLSDRLERLND